MRMSRRMKPIFRAWWLLGLPNPCHPRDPRLLLWRIRHRLTGPRRGCSCTRCFHHPKRRVPAREIYEDRVRLAKLELRLRGLELAHVTARRSARP